MWVKPWVRSEIEEEIIKYVFEDPTKGQNEIVEETNHDAMEVKQLEDIMSKKGKRQRR